MPPSTPRKSNGDSDFSADSMLFKQHTETLSALGKRVDPIEEIVKSPTKFAELLTNCITKAVDAQDSLSKYFIKMLQNNSEVKEVFKQEVVRVNRDLNVNFWTKIGGYLINAAISIAVTVIGGVILYLVLKK